MDAAALFVQPKMTAKLPSPRNIDGRRCDFTNITSILAYIQEEYAGYKYTVYRCAIKFVHLKKMLFTANIPYKLVLVLLSRYGILDEDINLMVPPFQLTAFVRDIYYTADKMGHLQECPMYSFETASAVLSSLFWNIFDPQAKHSISVLEIKVTLLLLCKSHLPNDIVTEFCNMLRDPKERSVTKRNFEYFLSILAKMFTYLGEAEAYGLQNVPIIKQQCLSRHNNCNFSENQYRNLWMSGNTRFIIYANLLLLTKRIEDAEKLIHSNVCAACHNEQIIGIRFKCDICRNLSLCMKCFATGFSASKHEPGHRMFEVFSEDEPPKKLSHFFAKFCKWPFKSHKNEELKSFCNTSEVAVEDNELGAMSTIHVSTLPASTSADASSGTRSSEIESSLAGLSNTASTASNISARLQSIIDRLLQQNVKLERQIKSVKTATNEEISQFLSAHQKFLIDIINEMRRFSQISKSMQSCPTASTPNQSVCDNAETAVVSAAKFRADGLSAAGSALTHSLNGADLNRSYLEANKSDLSIKDLSIWFNNRRMSAPLCASVKSNLLADAQRNINLSMNSGESFEIVDARDTEMINFKILLSKVKEIIEDSYSENSELAAATQNLENVLDNIVRNAEQRHFS